MNVVKFQNFIFEHNNNKGTLYNNGKIMFMGNSWSGILEFLRHTENAPEVRAMFKAQLEQREQIKYKLEKKEKVTTDPKKIKENWSIENKVKEKTTTKKSKSKKIDWDRRLV